MAIPSVFPVEQAKVPIDLEEFRGVLIDELLHGDWRVWDEYDVVRLQRQVPKPRALEVTLEVQSDEVGLSCGRLAQHDDSRQLARGQRPALEA